MNRRVWAAAAVLPVMAALAMVTRAAADGPVPLTSLHLDRPQATLSLGAGHVTAGGGCTGGQATSMTVQVTLSAASDGSALISYDGTTGPVTTAITPGQVQFNVSGAQGGGVTTMQMLTGSGQLFSGSGFTTSSAPACTVSYAATLVFAGSGLTVRAPSPAPGAAIPSPSGVFPGVAASGPTPAPQSSDDGFPWLVVIAVVVIAVGGATAVVLGRQRV